MKTILVRFVGASFLMMLLELVLPPAKASETALRAIGLICVLFVLEPIASFLGGIFAL